MGGAKNWRKDHERTDKIRWTHSGVLEFNLDAVKKDGRWILSLSTPNWPQKYDKKIIETGTKKRMKSFAYDWRKTNTETRSLLKEAGIWVDDTRRVFNPFNVAMVLMTFLLFLALLQTWNFIGSVFGNVLLGIIMGAGGLIFTIEGFYSGARFHPKAPVESAEETVSLLTGVFAVLSSYGYIMESEVLLNHFSGVQGGIFGFMFTYLLIHWVKDRIMKFSYLILQGLKNLAR